MCGIIGILGSEAAAPRLVEALKRLEYRGYDSAGVATLESGGMARRRAAGKIRNLEAELQGNPLAGHSGIGHTRWATHGAPSERNAHPHLSGGVCVVHNGIIENHEAVRGRLRRRGYRFRSDTDTEVIAHLVHARLATGGGLLAAVRAALGELRGAYAIAVICAAEPGTLVLARRGAPLLVGLGEGENFAASDAAALLQVTRRVLALEDGECAEVTRERVRIRAADGREVARAPQRSALEPGSLELGPHRHHMQKEILEQPAALSATLAQGGATLSPQALGTRATAALGTAEAALILACGTSLHAGMVARHWLESLAGIPCSVEIASEYRYRESAPLPRTLVIAISQSGETADTLAAVQQARSLGHRPVLALCNVPESSLARAADAALFTRAGPEIGVASTKSFTTQLAALALLALTLAQRRGRLGAARYRRALGALQALPEAVAAALRTAPRMAAWAQRLARREHALFVGRGAHWPIALEGALKLKEITYIHAEAYAAGELKHGPLALVDARMPVIALAPHDALLAKLQSNLQEVRARGGELYVIAAADARLGDTEAMHVARTPAVDALVSPIVQTVPLQLLAYHAALARGTDVDKPRNLAKSVTVE
jgi:glucosamine--fructose-6-phosphate aminotransferase (isomerizing)